MTKEQLKALIKKKIDNCIKDADAALEKHDHNSAGINTYYIGMARGYEDALSLVGMLDNVHNRTSDKTA